MYNLIKKTRIFNENRLMSSTKFKIQMEKSSKKI